MLSDLFERHSGKTLLVRPNGQSHTYAEIWEEAGRIASSLTAFKVKPQQKILISLYSSAEFLISVIACARGRFIACPIDCNLPQDRRLNYQTSLAPVYEINEYSYQSLLKSKSPTIEDVVSSKDDHLLMLPSSGTTGDIKVIVIGMRGMLASSASFARLTGVSDSSRFVHNLPMHYMAGLFNLLFVPISSGASIFIDPYTGPAKLLEYWTPSIQNDVNCLITTPTIVSSLTKIERNAEFIANKLKDFKMIFSTSSILYPSVSKAFQSVYQRELSSCYGVTEVGGSITFNSRIEKDDPYCVGEHDPVIKIKTKKINGLDKIFIKTPFMMQGYLRGGVLLTDLDEEGFFDTGDIGEYSDGKLRVTGRFKDSIKKGGEMVFLTDIENIALECNEVKEVAAIGKVDEYWGEKIQLFVVPNCSSAGEDQRRAIYNYLTDRLKKIEIPDEIIFINSIPKTSIGKQIKRFLSSS